MYIHGVQPGFGCTMPSAWNEGLLGRDPQHAEQSDPDNQTGLRLITPTE